MRIEGRSGAGGGGGGESSNDVTGVRNEGDGGGGVGGGGGENLTDLTKTKNKRDLSSKITYCPCLKKNKERIYENIE